MRMHDLVDLATSEPPPLRYTVDDIVESGERVRRRRRAGWAASGAAAVAVLGVMVAAALPSLASRPSTPTAGNQAGAGTSVATTAAAQAFAVPARPFVFTFDGYRVGKFQVARPIDVSTGYQIASVYADDLTTIDKPVDPSGAPAPSKPEQPRLYAYLTVYRPGAYDPTKLQNPQHVTIAGRPGLLSTVTPSSWQNARILAWQYGENAWAVLAANSNVVDNPSAADLEQVAAGLRPAAPRVATVPLTMSYVPAGYQLDEVAMHAMAGLNGISVAREGDYAGLLFSRPALPATGLTEPFGGLDGADPPGSFQIFVVPAGNSNQRPSAGLSCGDGFCNRWADGGSVNVQVSSGGRLSNEEMKKILNGITLRNVHDESTWTVVDTAIP